MPCRNLSSPVPPSPTCLTQPCHVQPCPATPFRAEPCPSNRRFTDCGIKACFYSSPAVSSSVWVQNRVCKRAPNTGASRNKAAECGKDNHAHIESFREKTSLTHWWRAAQGENCRRVPDSSLTLRANIFQPRLVSCADLVSMQRVLRDQGVYQFAGGLDGHGSRKDFSPLV